MFHARHRVKLLFLIIPMILASCNLLGVAGEDELTSIVTTDEQTPADQPDIQATVEEQVQATLQAQAALAPELPTPTTAPAKTAEPTAASSATPEAAVPSNETAAVRQAPVGDGEGMLIAMSANGLASVLTNAGWIEPQINVRFYETCSDSSSFAEFDGNGNGWLMCGNVGTSNDGVAWSQPEHRFNSNLFSDPSGRIWSVGGGQALLIQLEGTAQTFNAASTAGEGRLPFRTMAFDSNGTVWLDGLGSNASKLVSFDGETWTAYGEDVGLTYGAGPDVLFLTSKGELLAGVRGGVYIFENDAFREFIPNKQLVDLIGAYSFISTIHDIIELPGGDIWIATEEGVFVWNGAEVQILG
ncbi:MAG: hypothetical protein MI924_32910 [Chloroflexales bacterium]|nr:hypothetical protein [Chloroflexales bacterium]